MNLLTINLHVSIIALIIEGSAYWYSMEVLFYKALSSDSLHTFCWK